MIIAGLEKFTLLDYPGKMSAIIFTYGCDMRCPYCHNPELVTQRLDRKNAFSVDDVIDFLQTRVDKLEAVVITGGEPTIHRDLEDVITRIRELGYMIKLDTNGGSPERVESILELGIVDYWAMDIKYGKDLYAQGVNGGRKILERDVERSIRSIMSDGVDHEFRTTVMKGMHDIDSMHKIGEMINGADNYYIQNFRPGKTIDPTLNSQNSFTQGELEDFKRIMEAYVKNVYIR
ncbi:anaerobic ribonucleoside-triphosphate reductase activating protein [Candidatus Dojkabacteria bacterium]|uniref:Anaerobic ribonucleoside-triphosphate reductase activating protein n=1 Tax=Candidatus Dojkabacteria bacterium TaxID=2099670 RepID=A0A955I0Z0_9BACT|nr:anaerobic ribonucleoside-triphosphate reductase activating protein [Candidatus Dojkabacteria bacterium]